MSGLAFVLDPRDPTGAVRTVHAMLSAAPHRARDGTHVVAFEHGALGLALASTHAREARLRPRIDLARGVALVADARLLEPDVLARTLGIDADDDGDLLAAAWARWGLDLARHVRGDLALVAWDPRRRRIHAARDALGARPLFYAIDGPRVLFASELESLIAAGVSRAVDAHVVLEHLTLDHRHTSRTFFAAISRVLPGHHLSIDDGRVRSERWFEPPRRELDPSRFELLDALGRTFRAAVAIAIDTPHPVLAQLSGGLDSSAIVGAAAERVRAGAGPAVTTVSALYPGLPCDETPFIDAVTAFTGLPSERFDGTRSCFADYAGASLLHPGPPPTSGLEAEREIVARTGARVVLSGSGGDQLFFERGLFRDLARHGRFGALLHEAWLAPRYSTRSSRELLRDALSGLAPPALRGLRRRWRGVPAEPPSWLGAALVGLWRARAAEPPVELDLTRFTSSTQAFAWRWLTSAPMCWNVEVQELQASRLGLRLRAPFLDPRLVELVLATPWRARRPRGRMKALLRDGLAPLLPPLIRERTHVTSFETAVRHHVVAHAPQLEAVLEDGVWRSEPYVERRAVQEALAKLGAPSMDWRAPAFVWGSVMLELWLRRVEAVRAT